MTLSEHDWNQVFAPVMKLVKNWMKLPKNTPSLNSDSYAAIATQIRLRDAQLKSLIVDPIFDCDLHATSWIKLQVRKNVEIPQFPLSSIYRVATSNGHSHGRTNE
ncbi:hypothetical protein RIR_jg14777.t1 [Rhizophagus irregularis DAOM 181602=DAOM 197198]|nr:hypothetical protein RIR_jg14777.t1 [Rhizophagus irregularis DAOM 181602=DAOM 197198]